MIRAESFDVFDSVLMRDVLAPSEVFPRIGERLLSGNSQADLSAVEFGRLRVHAEAMARAASPEEDINLEEIWRQLAPMLGWPWSARLMDAELAEEEAALAPVESSRALLEAARRRHGRVIFVTDSYYPRSFLEVQLGRFALMVPGDALYISSEARRTKSSGSLFRHVLQKEGLSAHELRHHGDNAGSDIRVPRSLGVAVSRLTAPVLTRNELALIAPPLTSIPALRDIAGAARQFRQMSGGDDPGATEAVSAFLGPFCGLFAAWALASARRQGIERLYFCARDCQMAWKAAGILADRFGGMDCRYLYVSRQALFLPSVSTVDRRELHWLRRPFERPLLDRILAKLELRPDDWRSALAGIGHATKDGILLQDESEWARFWNAMETGPLRDVIAAKAGERRAAALAYFRSEGLFDGARIGLVDLGWHLTCQASLRKILGQAANGAAPQLRGFYLQLNGDRLPPVETGPALFMFTEPPADLDRFDPDVAFHHMDAFLEHVVGQATHGSTLGYEIDGDGFARPVLSKRRPSDAALARISRHHAAVETYVRRYAPRIARWSLEREMLPVVIHRVSDAFFRRAGAGAVSSLRHVDVSVDQNERDLHPLIEPISWWDSVRPVFPARLLRHPHRDPYHPWPHAKRLASSRLKNCAYWAADMAARVRSWLWRRVSRAA